MIDFHKTIVNTLNSILPTHYEMVLHAGLKTPCISYMELNNAAEVQGTTRGYSRLTYQVKVWGNSIEDLQQYAIRIDEALRAIGFRRISSGEIYDNQSAMIQKVLTFEALALEEF